MNTDNKHRQIKKLTLLAIAIATILLNQTACDQDKGAVYIESIADTVQNCTVPYIVQFYSHIDSYDAKLDIEWDFGDGQTTQNEENPQHVYNTPGIYTVKLWAKNYDAQANKTHIVNLQSESLPIISEFEYYYLINDIAPTDVQFINRSLHATSYFWDFGDNFGTISKDALHTFDQPGEYLVKLNAICNGDTTISSAIVNVKLPPNKLIIESVTAWLPASILPDNIGYQVKYHIFNEAGSSLDYINASQSPITWIINEEIFFFNGQYDQNMITVEIWSYGNIFDPLYVFSFPTSYLADNGYPTAVKNEKGDFAAEITFQYAYRK